MEQKLARDGSGKGRQRMGQAGLGCQEPASVKLLSDCPGAVGVKDWQDPASISGGEEMAVRVCRGQNDPKAAFDNAHNQLIQRFAGSMQPGACARHDAGSCCQGVQTAAIVGGNLKPTRLGTVKLHRSDQWESLY